MHRETLHPLIIWNRWKQNSLSLLSQGDERRAIIFVGTNSCAFPVSFIGRDAKQVEDHGSFVWHVRLQVDSTDAQRYSRETDYATNSGRALSVPGFCVVKICVCLEKMSVQRC